MSVSDADSRPPRMEAYERTRMILDLFEQVVELSPNERDISLHQRCADGAVRDRVKHLLEIHDSEPSEFDSPAVLIYEDLLRIPAKKVAHYEVIRELGRGGMGSIFLVWDTKLRCERAMKVLGAHDSLSISSRAAFLHEARVAAGLMHPNIIVIHDYGEAEDICFIAMQYVPGGTLASWTDRNSELSAGWDWAEQVLRIIVRLADALHHAHSHGVVHRDVKPQNVLMLRDDQPVLADFGIARVESNRSATAHLAGAGTVAYMSPEQVKSAGSVVDARSDIYSLGIVLYEMLSGEHPFRGDTVDEQRHNILRSRPGPLHTMALGIPHDLAVVCDRAIRREVEQRYPEAGVMASDLRKILDKKQLVCPVITRRSAVILAGGSVLSALAGAYAWRRLSDDRPILRAGGLASDIDLLVSVIDDDTLVVGRPTRLGRVSGAPYRLPTGHIRITLIDREGTILELTRVTEQGGELSISSVRHDQGLFSNRVLPLVPTLGDAAAISANVEWYAQITGVESSELTLPQCVMPMVKIPTCTEASFAPGTPQDYVDRVIPLGAFFIDQTEVTNAQYALYLSSVGGLAPPAIWPKGTLSSEILRRPVTGVSFEDAQGYAEWRGARLPTALEWERAVRGRDGRLFPWGNDRTGNANIEKGDDETSAQRPCALPGPDGSTPRPVSVDALVHRRDAYHDYCMDVLEMGEDVTPDGLSHMLGNVTEWTESILPAMGFDVRHTMGLAWSSPRRSLDRVRLIMDTKAWRIGIGFRCAQTVFSKEYVT